MVNLQSLDKKGYQSATVDRVGEIQPNQFAGAAKLLSEEIQQVAQPENQIDKEDYEQLYESCHQRLGVPGSTDNFIDPYRSISHWSRTTRHKRESTQGQWLPERITFFADYYRQRMGVCAIDNIASAPDEKWYIVPDAIQHKASVKLAEAAGGLTPVDTGVLGQIDNTRYCSAFQNDQYPMSSFPEKKRLTRPPLTPWSYLKFHEQEGMWQHDRYSGHLLGAIVTPPLARPAIKSASSALNIDFLDRFTTDLSMAITNKDHPLKVGEKYNVISNRQGSLTDNDLLAIRDQLRATTMFMWGSRSIDSPELLSEVHHQIAEDYRISQ